MLPRRIMAGYAAWAMTDLVHNEQTKLTATWLNSLASGLIVTGCIAPVVALLYGVAGPAQVGAGLVALGSLTFFGVGAWLHIVARGLLRRLRP
jgi:hypothetical protein